MEGVKSDDFAALLAALNSRSAPPPQPVPMPQFQPPQYMWQPVPVQAPMQVQAAKSSGVNTWIILILILAAVVFGAIAWMRTVKVTPEEDAEEEKEEEVEEEVKQLPVPSQVSEYESQYEKYDEDAVRDFVASNLLNFAKQPTSPVATKPVEEFDIAGHDLPMEVKSSSRRIVADESQEVIDYAKRREALFK